MIIRDRGDDPLKSKNLRKLAVIASRTRPKELIQKHTKSKKNWLYRQPVKIRKLANAKGALGAGLQSSELINTLTSS